jgi:hypothetical protein
LNGTKNGEGFETVELERRTKHRLMSSKLVLLQIIATAHQST